MAERGADSIAIVGGGRWARLTGTVLAGSQVPFRTLVFVTRANAAACEALRQSVVRLGRDLLVVPDLDEALRTCKLRAAVVANAARRHYDVTRRLLESRVPVLVEKPVVLGVAEARHLVDMSASSNTRLAPGLHLRYCSYLHNFAVELSNLGSLPRSFAITWSDSAAEIRHGERKTYDGSLNVAADVMPHVSTILFSLFGAQGFNFRECRVADGGRGAEFDLDVNGIPGTVSLRREGKARIRSVLLRFLAGRQLLLDFTEEPGTITLDGKTATSADPLWASRRGPLRQQLEEFLSSPDYWPAAAKFLCASVAFSEQAAGLMRQRQLKMATSGNSSLLGDAYYLRDLLAARLVELGLVAPGDNAALNRLAGQAAATLAVGPAGHPGLAALLRELNLIES